MTADLLAAWEEDQGVRETDDRTGDVVEIFEIHDSRIDDGGLALTRGLTWFPTPKPQ